MGMYTWLTESQFERFSKVQDKDMNEIFQEVRNLMPDEVFIEERKKIHKGFFGKKKNRKPVHGVPPHSSGN